MIDELVKLRELTETLTGNGYLRDQAEEWEYALDAIPDYVFVVDIAYKIKFSNKLLAERLNKTKQELYNKDAHEEICGEFIDETQEGWGFGNKHETVKVESVYLGNMRGWFDVTRSPILTKANKLIGFICVLQDVSEKLKALKDLVAREATLDTIFNAAPIGMGLLSKERVLLSVNKFLMDLTGYSENELVGQSVSKLYVSKREFERVGRIKHAEIAKVGIGALEAKFKTKAGKELDVYIRTSSITGSSNMVFTVMDITNRKKREKQIKLNEERLESALELSTMDDEEVDTIIEYALEEAVRLTNSEVGYIHFVNNINEDLSTVELSLFKWSKAVDEKCTAKKVPHYPLTEAGCWADSVRSGQPVIHNNYEILISEENKKGLPEGHFPLVRHMSIPVKEGKQIVAVAGVGNKLTDYNKSDVRQLTLFMNSMWDIISRKRAVEKLQESEAKYRLIAENLPDAIWTMDTEMNFTYINPVIEDLMGYKPEEWIGHNIAEFATTEDLTVMAEEVIRALANPKFKYVTFEANMLNKAGENIPIEINSKAIKNADGTIIGFQGRTRVLKHD